MPKDEFHLHCHLVFSKSQLKAELCLMILSGAACLLHSETITLTTLYPSPSGIYRRLITTMDTVLARDGGKVTIDDKKPAGLIVNGKLRIVDGSQGADKVLTSDGAGSARWKPPAAAVVAIDPKTCRWVSVSLWHEYGAAYSSACDVAKGEVMTGFMTSEPNPQWENHDIQCRRFKAK